LSERFEQALRDGLGDKVKDDAIAKQLWSALANVDWYHPESHDEASYSFRAAGGLIADLRGAGCYMDWYCCGPYAEVSDLIAHTLKKQGWIFSTIGTICDEPGCIKPAGIWSGGRGTCSSHMAKT
jgi:hypothetical protein